MTDEARFQALNDAVQEILRRQAELEERLSRLEAAPGPASPSPQIPTTQLPPPGPPVARHEPETQAIDRRTLTRPAGERPAIESRVGLTVINRVVVITLVLGGAFFF